MSKFDKKTIATVLAFASLFGNKTSATTINSQTVGAVGGAASSNSEKLKKTQGMGIGPKIAIGATVLTAGVVEAYNEIAGAVSGKKWYSGKYSLVNLIRVRHDNWKVIIDAMENYRPIEEKISKEIRERYSEEELKERINWDKGRREAGIEAFAKFKKNGELKKIVENVKKFLSLAKNGKIWEKFVKAYVVFHILGTPPDSSFFNSLAELKKHYKIKESTIEDYLPSILN
ncbi:MAG: hypothetical protein IJQ10_03485, partial [Clostridia bacterium]|nr:hypothetical protein [Clostridia bacterium]